MAGWQFMSSVGTSRSSAIEEWLLEVEQKRDRKKKVRNRFHTILRHLHITTIWREPYYEQLNNADGVGEIKVKVSNIQYRVFGFFGPQGAQFTMLLGGHHKDDVYTPRDAIEKSIHKKRLIIEKRLGVMEYEFLG